MTPQEKIYLTQVLLSNAIDYWYEVDLNWGQNARDYYFEDSTFSSMVGRDAIHQFYMWRKDRGARVSRHLITNFRAEFESPTKARTNYVMLLFAADGEPVLPSAPPIQIAEQVDEVELCEDGRWRFRSRKFINLFKGETPTTSPPKDWYAQHSPESKV
jgi:hypothetical protein